MKKVIITYILGGYDRLKEPTEITPGWDYLCFSDVGLRSDIWQPMPLRGRPLGVNCPKRRSSLIKINHHKFISDRYDVCVTLDGSMQINCNLDGFIEEFWSDELDLAIARHPKRSCLYDEASAVLELQMDDPEIVNAQICRYREQGFPINYGLYGTRMMIKNNRSGRLRSMCECWEEEYRAGSRRDQLSLTYSIWKDTKRTGDPVRIRPFDFNDVYHARELFRITPHLGSARWH